MGEGKWSKRLCPRLVPMAGSAILKTLRRISLQCSSPPSNNKETKGIEFVQTPLTPRSDPLPPPSWPLHERRERWAAEPLTQLCLTILAVVEDIHLAFFSPKQGLCQAGHSTAWSVGACEEVTGTGLLHHLYTGVAEEFTEAIIAVNDGTVLHLCIGNQELTTWSGRES